MNIKNEIERLIKIYGKEIAQKLYDGKFELESSGDHTSEVKVDDEYFSIWMANSDDNTDFYDNLRSDYCDIMTKLCSKYSHIKKEYRAKIRENIKVKIKELEDKNGLRKPIEKTKYSNDLFFKFQGVWKEVKFTGYNDNDWWTKYKPTKVKEDENIIWTIDYETMTAIYKPTNK